jgi:anti-sigma regulatory factor (Ser/Thr protein kinase)
MATVELSFTPLPAHVRTARLVATAVARRSGVDESLLDEVRLAVGEACSRAVEGHQLHCPAEPVRLALTDLADRFEVEVTDTCLQVPAQVASQVAESKAPLTVAARQAGAGLAGADGDGLTGKMQGGRPPREALPHSLGIAVIAGLADDVVITETDAGTVIRMSWPSAGSAS